MPIQKRDNISNWKGSGFDTDADFIPFELSDDEVIKSVHKPRTAIEAAEQRRGRQSENDNVKPLDRPSRKRKSSDPSHEQGRPTQGQKFANVTVNPWQYGLTDYDSCKETSRILHKEVVDFSNWIYPTEKEQNVRAFVVKRIVDSIQLAFPECRVSPFGSYNTMLYTPDADIDMVASWPGHVWTKESMRKLGRHIEKTKLGRGLHYIFGARVPIIKFVDTFARIDMDLSFNQNNALDVVALVQRYLREMPALRPLVMVLKTLFHQRNLSIPAEGGLGSYSIICMVISFLQRHPKIAGGHIRADDNLGAMLLEILELYGTRFNFNRVGIAVDDGGSYFEKSAYQDIDQNRWRNICVRDPNDPTNNIAKASHQKDNIIKVFQDAFHALTMRCYLVHARIKNGESAPWGTRCGSILDAIIERPEGSVRERLESVWTPQLVEAIDSDFQLIVQRTSSALSPSQPKKPNRAERRAARRAAESMKLQEETAEKAKKKKPITMNSVGTKDSPIVLDDSSPCSPYPSPSLVASLTRVVHEHN